MVNCRGLSKTYAGQPVLCGVDLLVQPGICALLGANGAGKSTLLRLLAGLERPDAGSIHISGLNFGNQAIAIKMRLGVLPEGLALFESLTVLENLQAVGPIYSLTPAETEARANDLLRLLDLTQGRHTLARECSFGMRKKTALAMALLHRPDVLLLDEPFEGIDPASSLAIQTTLRQLAASGATILLTSHLLQTVQNLADRILILHQGHLAADLNPTELTEPLDQLYFATVGKPEQEIPGWLNS